MSTNIINVFNRIFSKIGQKIPKCNSPGVTTIVFWSKYSQGRTDAQFCDILEPLHPIPGRM